MLQFVIGVIVGVGIGVVLMAALVAGGRSAAERPSDSGQIPSERPPAGHGR